MSEQDKQALLEEMVEKMWNCSFEEILERAMEDGVLDHGLTETAYKMANEDYEDGNY